MKKNIAFILTTALLFFTGCQNYDHLIPEEFGAILSLKQIGELKTNLYTTGEDGEVALTIMKGGSDPTQTATAELSIMSAAELAEYAQRTGILYEALPQDTYEIEQPKLSFDANKGYQNRKITLKTNKIKELFDANPDHNYALPLVLTSLNDSVNTEKNIVIVKPDVLVPTLQYELNHKTLNTSAGELEYEFRLKLPFISPWDFEANVGVDSEILGDGYELIPESEYTMTDGGKVVFKKGNTVSEPLKVTLKEKSKLLVGNRNALPLRLLSTTKEGIQIPEQPFVLYATELNRLPLTVDMVASNAPERVEGPIAALVDGDPGTYFHSAYTYGIRDMHNIVVTLSKPVTRFAIKYQNRSNNNGKPQDIRISAFGNNWTEVGHINQGLPVAPGSVWSSPSYVVPAPITKIMIEVLATNDGRGPRFFNMAELYVYGL